MIRNKFESHWLNHSEEFIICAAIWFDDGKEHPHQPKNIESGFVISGRRHHNCFITLAITTNRDNARLYYERDQGFITNKDRYVGREEAALIAYTANQTNELKNRLFSEDLY